MEKTKTNTDSGSYLLQINSTDIPSIKSPTQFMQEIDKLVDENKMEYIDAVIHFCTLNDIEIETAASLIKGSAKMKAKIQLEAEELNYLPKSSRLPL
jgi:hypothetical protein